MSDLDGLVPWLHEQLDARERTARAAAEAVEGGDWSPRDDGGVAARGPRGITVALGPEGFMNPAVEDHIAAHDPARVLRDIEAKKRLIGNHKTDDKGCCRTCAHWTSDWVDGFKVDRVAYEGVRAPCLTLRLLALPYTDRPGYREEWRP